MALTIHRRHLTLNTDGIRHPLVNSLILATAGLGLFSVAMAAFEGLHAPGAWAGGVGALGGASAQMLSATTAERFAAVFGLGACCVGFAINMAHGGPF